MERKMTLKVKINNRSKALYENKQTDKKNELDILLLRKVSCKAKFMNWDKDHLTLIKYAICNKRTRAVIIYLPNNIFEYLK